MKYPDPIKKPPFKYTELVEGMSHEGLVEKLAEYELAYAITQTPTSNPSLLTPGIFRFSQVVVASEGWVMDFGDTADDQLYQEDFENTVPLNEVIPSFPTKGVASKKRDRGYRFPGEAYGMRCRSLNLSGWYRTTKGFNYDIATCTLINGKIREYTNMVFIRDPDDFRRIFPQR